MWGVRVLPVCRLLRDPGRWGCGGVQLRSGIVVSARSAVLIASAQGQLAGSRRRRRRPVRMSRPGMAKILRCRVAVVARCKSGPARCPPAAPARRRRSRRVGGPAGWPDLRRDAVPGGPHARNGATHYFSGRVVAGVVVDGDVEPLDDLEPGPSTTSVAEAARQRPARVDPAGPGDTCCTNGRCCPRQAGTCSPDNDDLRPSPTRTLDWPPCRCGTDGTSPSDPSSPTGSAAPRHGTQQLNPS